jgi:hypothetical protein
LEKPASIGQSVLRYRGGCGNKTPSLGASAKTLIFISPQSEDQLRAELNGWTGPP